MPLPTSREETATGASPVSSNTINVLQDQIIALNTSVVALKAARSIVIPACDAIDLSGSHTRSEDHFALAASANKILFPIVIPTGAVITGYAVICDKETDAGNTIAYRLYSCDAAGVVAGASAGGSSAANAPGFGTLFGESGLAITVVATKSYWLRFTPGAGILPGPDLLYQAKINFTP